MEYSGPLSKMFTIHENPVKYLLDIGDDILNMNDLVGRELGLNFTGSIKCFCGEIKTKVYRSNFCYDCFYSKPEAGESIFYPEKSMAHLGKEDRDLEWEKRMQLQPHVVYLANSAGLKVGVTRGTQVPTRWIDQGASQALKFAEVPNRYLAGVIEVEMKKHISDKPPWQRMVKNEVETMDLVKEKANLKHLLPEETKEFYSSNDEVYSFEYPVDQYPIKVKSVNFNKVDSFRGKLQGIKGQYLLFEGGAVFNVRSHEGYITNLQIY